MIKKNLFVFILFALTSALGFANISGNAEQLLKAAGEEFDANRFEASLPLYLKADSAYRAEGKGNTAEYAHALHATGRAYLNLNDFDKGRDFTLQAMNLREQLFGKVSKEYINSLNNYGLSYLLTNDLQMALKLQSEVVELCGKMDPAHPDEGMYLINLARIYHALQDDDTAVKYMEEALPKVEKFSANYEYALNFLGNVYMDKNDNANAYRILGLMEEHNQHELSKECDTPECHLERADYYTFTGQPANAKEEYMTVFSMALTDRQKANAYSQYAKFLSSQRDHAEAGEYYNMAANILLTTEGENETITSLQCRAGLSYFISSEYDKAIEAHKKVIESVDKFGYTETLKSSSLQGLGNAYSGKKQYSESICAFKQWIEHLRANGHENETDYAKAYERLASSEKFNSDFDASIADYETAIGLYEKLGMHDEADQAKSGLTMCLIYAKRDLGEEEDNQLALQQRDDKTREILNSSLNALAQGGDYLGKLSTAQSYATFAGCYNELGELATAIEYYEKYLEAIRPALAEDFLLKNAKERELTWRNELSNINEIGKLIAELPQDTPDLFSRISNLIYSGQLLSKGILLSSNVEFDKVLDRYGNADTKTRYEQIKKNLAAIETMKQQRKPIEEIMQLSRENDADQLALSRELASEGIYTDFLKYTPEDVVKSLQNDEAAVEFVTLPTGITSDFNLVAAVLISWEFPQGLTLPIGSVGDLKTMISDKDKFSKTEYADAVWGGIFQAAMGKNTIYFAPDGVLNNVGIEYLTANGTPISELKEMHRLSSTREICREHRKQPIYYAALFGNIDYQGEGLPASGKRGAAAAMADIPNFGSLVNTEREITEIHSILKSASKDATVNPYSGVAASKDQFLAHSELPVNLLHIATHGLYREQDKSTDDNAMNHSLLAFAGANRFDTYEDNDGIVSAAEIAEMSLRDCDLVVLSACESGLGKLGSDGVFGLQRGFKNAGVKTLLVSLNEVADKSTADMMIAFYGNLMKDGASKHEALKKAQSEIRSKYPDDDIWASFILIDSLE